MHLIIIGIKQLNDQEVKQQEELFDNVPRSSIGDLFFTFPPFFVSTSFLQKKKGCGI